MTYRLETVGFRTKSGRFWSVSFCFPSGFKVSAAEYGAQGQVYTYIL
jgi:hypothetical protein